ncbi:MAG TPA: UvrB/UvrC motif-containing protein [Tissierellaceae bacterium]|nr:UvrB/UvrC motif-containing protein [Tissierellaceae bacterium]
MLCESCNKNKATIHYKKIVNGKIEEKHLCESCIKESNEFDFKFALPFHKIFIGLLDSIGEVEQGNQDFKKINCPQCGLDYKKFMDTGKFGCEKCYEVFKEDINSLLKNIHGHNEHKGKLPKRLKGKILKKREIDSLREDLKDSIDIEDFEKAAILRDEIKKIRDKIESSEE